MADPIDDLDAPILPDEDDSALNDGGEDTATTASPTDGKQTTDESEATGSEGKPGDGEAQPKDNSKAEEEDSKGKRPDKQSRLNERFSELTSKLQEKDATIDDLHRQLDQVMNKPPQLKRDENGEANLDDLLEHTQKVAERAADDRVAASEMRLEGERVANRFDTEVNDALREHPMLDPDSDQFNEAVAKAVDELVNDKIGPHLLAKNVRALSKVSVKEIINRYMAGVYAAADAARSTVTQNLNKLKSDTSGALDSSAAHVEEEDELLKAFEKEFE